MPKPGARNPLYTLEYLDTVMEYDIPRLPKTMRERNKRAVEHRVTVDPVGLGKPLRYSLVGHRQLRIGDYCVVYRIDALRHAVRIVAIKHRKDVYES